MLSKCGPKIKAENSALNGEAPEPDSGGFFVVCTIFSRVNYRYVASTSLV